MDLLFFGFLGGVMRGLVGFLKHQYAYKQVPLRPLHTASMITASGVVGLVAALAFRGLSSAAPDALTATLSVVTGYAGSDFLENAFKIILKRPDFWGKP